MMKTKYSPDQKLSDSAGFTARMNQRMDNPKSIDPNIDFTLEAWCAAFSKTIVSLLEKCVITPEIIRQYAFHHAIWSKKPIILIMSINRCMKIKKTEKIATGYPHKLTDFTNSIIFRCQLRKVKKCVIVYNYDYKRGPLSELNDLNTLYTALKENGITLVDAVKVKEGNAQLRVSPYNSSGYLKDKQTSKP